MESLDVCLPVFESSLVFCLRLMKLGFSAHILFLTNVLLHNRSRHIWMASGVLTLSGKLFFHCGPASCDTHTSAHQGSWINKSLRNSAKPKRLSWFLLSDWVSSAEQTVKTRAPFPSFSRGFLLHALWTSGDSGISGAADVGITIVMKNGPITCTKRELIVQCRPIWEESASLSHVCWGTPVQNRAPTAAGVRDSTHPALLFPAAAISLNQT